MAILDWVLLVRSRGKEIDVNFIQIYPPTAYGAGEQCDIFKKDLTMAMAAFGNGEMTIVLCNFNANVGQERDKDITGRYGLVEWSGRGDYKKNLLSATSQMPMGIKQNRKQEWKQIAVVTNWANRLWL